MLCIKLWVAAACISGPSSALSSPHPAVHLLSSEEAGQRAHKADTRMSRHKAVDDCFAYGDGSGNGYTVYFDGATPVRFTYRPITPRESSSGTYSGGAAVVHERVLQSDADALFGILGRIFAATEDHCPDRAMGTGCIKQVPTCLVKHGVVHQLPLPLCIRMGSASQRAIEEWLHAVKGRT